MFIIFGILLFSFLIFIHELGHFITAKLSGVQVNEFSMFMGPAIWKKQKGETLYSLRCIPLGGYCAMEGEDGDSENPRAFGRAAWWKRLIILVAGAVMNFVAGILLMVIVSMSLQVVVPTIAEIEPNSSLAAEGGFQVGDIFLEIDGEKVESHTDFSEILARNPGDIHDFVIQRGDKTVILEDFALTKKLFGTDETPRYGFTFGTEDASLGTKLGAAWDYVVYSVKVVWMSLEMLLTGQVGLQDMSGPVGIVQQMGQVANSSATVTDAAMNMLYFGGFIAVNLAIMNLLPIPALDGGRVVALLLTTGIEAITKKKLNPKYEGYIHGIGMFLLLALMAVIMLKDIIFIFK